MIAVFILGVAVVAAARFVSRSVPSEFPELHGLLRSPQEI